MQIIKTVLVALLFVLGNAHAQTVPVENTATAVVGNSDAAIKAVAQTWFSKEKFTVMWSLVGSRDQSWTAFPQKKEFTFNSDGYCEGNGPYATTYSVDSGKLLIAVKFKRPGCGVAEMRFDPVSLEGTIELVDNGKRDLLPGRILRLR